MLLYKNKKLKISLLILIVQIIVYQNAIAASSDSSKMLRVEWEEEDGAIKYNVQISDSNNTIVINKSTKTNYIKFLLPPGKYRFRLRVVNKFQKVSEWSDWSDFEIARKLATRYRMSLLNLGFRAGAGVPYFKVQPRFNKIIEDSYKGVSFNLGFWFGYSRLFRAPWFLRFWGIEFETNYINFPARDLPNQTTVDATIIMPGGSLLFTTRFNLPINLIFRAGGGIALSELNYHSVSVNSTDKTLTSQDPYYRIGSSIEFSFYYFFIESGIDYFIVQYIGDKFKTIRYFGLAGIRF